MAELKQVQRQSLKQSQKQVQRMSQQQIQGLKFLKLSSRDLKRELDQYVQENPALEYLDKTSARHNSSKDKHKNKDSADAFQAALEASESLGETLQEHLISQLNILTLSVDEQEVCRKLIYNLDKNGFYGSSLAPETLLDKNRPHQNMELLNKCISIIQQMEPYGICCRNIEESLYVQAKLNGDASKFTLFILDGHLDLLNPPEPERVVKHCKEFLKTYHSKTFTKRILLDEIDLTPEMAEETYRYISRLNFHPAAGYVYDSNAELNNKPDIVLTIKKESGYVSGDDFNRGIVACGKDYYFQVKYASGELPELQLVTDHFATEKEINEAKMILNNLKFRESTLILQGCAIVKEQLEFFDKGQAYLKPLTRRKIAKIIGVHESTVSRTSSKNDSKCFQTDWGIFKASYFFSSGVASSEEEKGTQISSLVIKQKIRELIEQNSAAGGKTLSDSKITEILNEQGIKIARRTVAKYREQSGVKNSYFRS